MERQIIIEGKTKKISNESSWRCCHIICWSSNWNVLVSTLEKSF